MPDFNTNACAGFSADDREALWQAATTLVDAQAFIGRIIAAIGAATAWAKEKAGTFGAEVFGEGWQARIDETIEQALWKAMGLATLGLDPNAEEAPWDWFNKAVTFTSGTVTGFFGLAGAAIDIPISTLLMLRSIADIARAHGEDPATEETRQACLQVFAFGGKAGDGEEPEATYWAAKAALAALPAEVLIRQAAARLGVLFSDKLLAQAAPVAGALAGGAVNYMFMDYYQQIARVHFTLRRLERQYKDPDGVRACFDNLVRQATALKKLKREKAEAEA
jgi:hypothetical protein